MGFYSFEKVRFADFLSSFGRAQNSVLALLSFLRKFVLRFADFAPPRHNSNKFGSALADSQSLSFVIRPSLFALRNSK